MATSTATASKSRYATTATVTGKVTAAREMLTREERLTVAAQLVADHPRMSGAEVGRRLGLARREGVRLKNEGPGVAGAADGLRADLHRSAYHGSQPARRIMHLAGNDVPVI